MNVNDRVKLFKRASARYGMFGSYWLINHLPYPLVKVLLHVLIGIGFVLTIRLKRIARESLHTAFGYEKTDQEITKIIKDCFENFGRGMIEMIYLSEHQDKIKDHVKIEGMENLQQALGRGNGVIAVTAHFGNFPLMMLTFAKMGFKTNVMMRKTRDPAIDEFLYVKRTASGLNTIYAMPRKQAVQSTIKALRNNEIVFILMDHNFGSEGGVFVDFFGQKAATAPGPIVIAHRTGASIVPFFIRREKGDLNKVVIEPRMELEPHEDYDQMIYNNVFKVTKIIENQIRKYPHEWGWMHRRWKSKDPLAPTVAPPSPSVAIREEANLGD